MSVITSIELLNLEFTDKFSKIPGLRIYGLSELVSKKNQDGSVYVVPGVIQTSGEITYVGYDDKTPLVIYHRMNSASQIERPASSYGDDRTDQITTFQMSMYIYADRKIVCPDQFTLLEFIQTSVPGSLIVSGYKMVIPRIVSANFNTQQILKSEYSGSDAKLRPERILIQINYQIETTFRKKCVARCA